MMVMNDYATSVRMAIYPLTPFAPPVCESVAFESFDEFSDGNVFREEIILRQL